MSKRYKHTRHPRKSQGALIAKIALAAIILIGLALYASRNIQPQNDQTTNRQTMPGQAQLWKITTPPDLLEIMAHYTGFTVSFNPDMHVPNYVIWELTANEAQADSVTRSGAKFTCDYSIEGCPDTYDYRNSGFDRGHMCPAADMKWSRQAMDDCHIMTNIAPQTHKLHGGPWKTLESNCRKWALRDSALIIISGPILTDRLSRRIGTTGVIVPERYFKVVLAPYANPPRGIAFIMNNYDTTGGVQPTATTIDEVETITGFDFFAALPDEIENQVESQSNYQQWQRLKTR